MATIHIVLQGKGGVGKSLVATCLAQFLTSTNKKPLCFDIDPVNASFSSFKALNVEHINLLEHEEINPRLFDDLIEKIAQATDDVVIDSGASTFVPLSHYLLTNQIAELLKEMGHSLYSYHYSGRASVHGHR